MTDLTLSYLNTDFPKALTASEIYNYSLDLNNLTDVLTTGDFRIGTYLSTDLVIDAADILVGDISTGNILANSTTVNREIQVNGSDYYFILFVDDLETIDEMNENNNTVISSMTFDVVADDSSYEYIFI